MINLQSNLFEEIEQTIKSFDVNKILDERKTVLQPLIDYIQSKLIEHQDIRINFICTHNSRRSHLSQVWAQAIAHHFNIKNVYCYSGGTEATALFPMIASTLINHGFQIEKIGEGSNPIHAIKYAANEHPVVGFSKKYNSSFNPKSKFAAIMTCTQADGDCPLVLGAEIRIPITYEDPKAFDNTAQMEEKYNERSLQIAAELYYVFSQIQ